MSSEIQQLEMKVMGQIIGLSSTWDQMDTWSLLICNLQMNDLGRRFVPDFPDGDDLGIDFERGIVALFDDDGQETILRADWSVFNRETGSRP
jgi:hypothetical protein